MRAKPLVRDVTLMAAAGLFGWFAHRVDKPVQASTADPLSFQVSVGGDRIPSLFVASTHTLYVYPLGTANNHINCSYSLAIGKPGEPIERSNCPIGSPFGH